MRAEQTGNGRVRAWVLVRAESAQEVAQALYKELGHAGGDSFVVVRADAVDYSYNIIIPVDAESEDVLYEVDNVIKGHAGVSETVVVKVENPVPYPPHDAHGYITEREWEAGKDKTIEPGRQLSASPGANPFG